MKIMNKTLTAGAISIIVSANTASSKTPASTSTPFVSGFYAGANLGYLQEGHRYQEKRLGINNINPNTSTPFSFKSHKKSNCLFPGLFAGYRYSLGLIFLGFELSANLNGSKSKSNFIDKLNIRATESIKAKYNIIPAFMLGMPIRQIDNLNIYGKIGYDIAKYYHNISELRVNGTVYNKESKTSIIRRFQIAFGTEYSINKRLSTRFEMAHSFGKTINGKMAGKLPADNAYCSNAKVATTSVKIGVFIKA